MDYLSFEDYLNSVSVWVLYDYTFSGWHVPSTITRLSARTQQLLRDIGQALCNRMRHGINIGELTTRNIKIIDGIATLPQPPIDRRDFRNPIQEYENICLAVFNYKGIVSCPEKSHFLGLFQRMYLNLNSSKNPNLLAFQNLFFHFIFQSPNANLLFLINALEFLEDNEKAIAAQLGGGWRRCYKKFSRYRDYNIKNSIGANSYLEGVYRYHQDPNNPTRPPYDDSCVGLLRFLTNVKKHANQQRRKHGCCEWRPEELEVLIEFHFPGEMVHLFDFFWTNNLLMDFTQSLRDS